MLARELEAEMRRAFAQEFVVGEEEPGPGTLRVRSALTAAIAAAKSLEPGLLQYVEIELELLDTATNRRIAAAVDWKESSVSPASSGESYVRAAEAFRDWADRASIRVAALRSLDRQYGHPDSP